MHGDVVAPRNQEATLIDLLERIARNPEGRAAAHVHLSFLRPHNRQRHHLRIAREVMTERLEALEAQMFTLNNDDVALVCRSADREAIDQATGKLRQLFRTDPLARDAGGDGSTPLYTWYELEADVQDLVAVLRSMAERNGSDAMARTRKDARKPLEPKALGQVEDSLSKADLSTLVRRQQVCAMGSSKAEPKPILWEYYVAIAELQNRVLPDVDLLANRYLFQHLTETLDRRVLSMLARAGEPKEGADISINLNISTLFSAEFLEFDRRLGAAARAAITFELQVSDVFADLADFGFARDYVQAKGYRVALDGATHLTLPLLDAKRLGVDLVKIYWSSDLADYLEGDHADWMRSFVDRTGRERVVLCRVDDENAIDVGNAFGIEYFQGRHVDTVLRSKHTTRETENRDAAAAG